MSPLDRLNKLFAPRQASRLRKKLALWSITVVSGLLLIVALLTALGRPVWYDQFRATEDEAKTLALTYDAVVAAGRSLWDKPVLWRIGCQGMKVGTCYYEADLGKAVMFPDGTEIPSEGHKGMSLVRVLARVKRTDPRGVYLELVTVLP